MKKIVLIIILFTCARTICAQVNYVKNPSFEEYYKCPDAWDQITYAKYWSGAVDSDFVGNPEYINCCAIGNYYSGSPLNIKFFQSPRTGYGMSMATFFYDGSMPIPPSPLPVDYRDYIQGRLIKTLTAGRSYCVTFYLNSAERSGYVHNNIGAYLDDGSFDDTCTPGSSLTFVVPQVNSLSIVHDTAHWIRVEGNFISNGTEAYITIGNFFKNVATSYTPMPDAWGTSAYSYYLLDDVSVVETDLPANAGIDKGIHIGDSTFIGRSLDSAFGLDCKWYHKGSLIDSGSGIWVKPTAKGVDTYTVIQTICGNVKTDTVLVYTFDVGIEEFPGYDRQSYELFPNPSQGKITIRQFEVDTKPVAVTIYNSQGIVVLSESAVFSDKNYLLQLSGKPPGIYSLQLRDHKGRSQNLRFTLEY